MNNKTLKMSIEKTSDMSDETVKSFYNLIYRMAENMGFEVRVPSETHSMLSDTDETGN
tara:strand:- start:1311 stop:1484 length:174 start_codon:yes stop_codon:yes gene_type:complete